MNASQPIHEMIPGECPIYNLLGGILPPSATEVHAVLIFLVVINIITFPFTTTLNLLVIIAVMMKSRLRDHKSNILLACLATTDLMVGAIVQPMFASLMITVVLGETTPGSCVLQNLILISQTPAFASLIHLALISAERYLAMKHTFAYHDGLVTEARLLIASALAWLLSLSSYIPIFFGLTESLFFVIIFNTLFGLCFAIIIFCQIMVYREIRRHEKEIATQQVTEEARQKFLKDKKAFKLIAIVVSVLFLSYVPIILFRLVMFFWKNMSLEITYVGIHLAVCFVILNSLLNPLIYSVRMRQFRVAFVELICRTANIAETEEIEMRYFGSPNAVVRVEAGQQDGDQQNEEQANVNMDDENNDIFPQNENHIEEIDNN